MLNALILELLSLPLYSSDINSYLSKAIKIASENAFYHKGVFWSDDYVEQCYAYYNRDSKAKSKLFSVEDRLMYPEAFEMLVEEWRNMGKNEKMVFWNTYCADRRPE